MADSGSILLDGVELSQLPEHIRARFLGGGLGVQGGGVLIQQQQLGLLQGGHQQGQGLAMFEKASGGEFANDRMLLS